MMDLLAVKSCLWEVLKVNNYQFLTGRGERKKKGEFHKTSDRSLRVPQNNLYYNRHIDSLKMFLALQVVYMKHSCRMATQRTMKTSTFYVLYPI